jgi:hypothetical protein
LEWRLPLLLPTASRTVIRRLILGEQTVIQRNGSRSSSWGLLLWKGDAGRAGPETKTTTVNRKKTVMKINIIAAIAVAGLLAAGTTFAQSGPGQGQRGQGKGYGGPPQSEAERAARQAACLEKNGGVCPNGGPGLGQGKGKLQGQGKGQRNGLRDGTGPRSQDGTCPLGNTPAQRGRWHPRGRGNPLRATRAC